MNTTTNRARCVCGSAKAAAAPHPPAKELTRPPQPTTKHTTSLGAGVTAKQPTLYRSCEDGCRADELYRRSLAQSVRRRAWHDSRNASHAHRFTPDEQLMSMRDDAEASQRRHRVSSLVPVRRRDRLQELLVLETRERLRQEERGRLERAAYEQAADDQATQGQSYACNQGTHAAGSMTSEWDSTAAMQPSNTLQSHPAGCSAESHLRDIRCALREIAAMPRCAATTTPTLTTAAAAAAQEADASSRSPLTRAQIARLRTIIHDQVSQAQKESTGAADTLPLLPVSGRAPRMCHHCYETQVQAKNLCLTEPGSIAFRETGKVINPARHVCFGTAPSWREVGGEGRDGAKGTHRHGRIDDEGNDDDDDTAAAASSYRAAAAYVNFDASALPSATHPQGGAVIIPTVCPESGRVSGRACAAGVTCGRERQMRRDASNDAKEVDDGHYDQGYGYQDTADTQQGTTGRTAKGPLHVGHASTPRWQAEAAAVAEKHASAVGGPVEPVSDASALPTMSSLWRTTNQQRELDARRYMKMQQALRESAGRAYDRHPSQTNRSTRIAA